MRKGKLINGALELFFPSSLYCACCGNLIDESRTYRLCDFCLSNFRWNLEGPEVRDGVRYISCVEYGVIERSLIFRLKYSGDKHIARIIAEIMSDKLDSAAFDDSKYCYDSSTAVVPVPLHRKKEKKRGFNQAALIAKHFAGEKGFLCLPRALLRTKETEAMRGLNKEERLANILGSIEVNSIYEDDLAGRDIIVMDDFYTTGSTAKACIDALKRVGPKSITFFTYARRTPFESIKEKRIKEKEMKVFHFADII